MENRQPTQHAAPKSIIESRRDFLRRAALCSIGMVSLTATPQEVLHQADKLKSVGQTISQSPLRLLGLKPHQSEQLKATTKSISEFVLATIGLGPVSLFPRLEAARPAICGMRIRDRGQSPAPIPAPNNDPLCGFHRGSSPSAARQDGGRLEVNAGRLGPQPSSRASTLFQAQRQTLRVIHSIPTSRHVLKIHQPGARGLRRIRSPDKRRPESTEIYPIDSQVV